MLSRILFALGALLALASAQCSVEGNTYGYGALSITFGTAVGDWVPALFNKGDISTVSYGTWQQATASRWEVQDFGSVNGDFCNSKGQYNLVFLADCNQVRLTEISDSCTDRAGAFQNVFTMVARSSTADCVSIGTQLTTTFKTSLSAPVLSGELATFVFGNDEFAVVSVGKTGAFFQRWSLSQTTAGDTATVVDFGSVPTGLSCSSSQLGTYLTNWGADCAARFCGVSDTCTERGELFHGAAVNGFTAVDECPRPIDNPGFGGTSACSPNNEQWLKHPWDCLEQPVEGGCIFCRGIANGETVSTCIDRLGSDCNAAFESNAGRAFCNLAFECPASTTSLSVVVVILSVLAFLLH